MNLDNGFDPKKPFNFYSVAAVFCFISALCILAGSRYTRMRNINLFSRDQARRLELEKKPRGYGWNGNMDIYKYKYGHGNAAAYGYGDVDKTGFSGTSSSSSKNAQENYELDDYQRQVNEWKKHQLAMREPQGVSPSTTTNTTKPQQPTSPSTSSGTPDTNPVAY
jgi:hypothetical protein